MRFVGSCATYSLHNFFVIVWIANIYTTALNDYIAGKRETIMHDIFMLSIDWMLGECSKNVNQFHIYTKGMQELYTQPAV